MTIFQNQNDRTALQVEHDAHGCTVLTAQSHDESVAYGIPRDQLPTVMLEMAGGEVTAEEQQTAMDFLNDPTVAGATMDDLIGAVRKTLLALNIRMTQEAAGLEAEADAPADEPDPLDDMSRDDLLAEAKKMREGYERLLTEQEETRQALWNANQRVDAVLDGLGNTAEAMTALVARMRGEQNA